eukprot:gnl/TRDRNA2_/TRDRNA2_177598_c0_seq1.p1 gnl/TRDRNA2_/TRDRNA2_177598_c0~~gnl/TRDRNA2_/TRDRNA2_177598_c0_seq1.p1  ORF type:complete len:232 (-),score=21.70 gnl/TRDRNA2_/TRDRNA2_177598_c0_seq1:77-772(-)
MDDGWNWGGYTYVPAAYSASGMSGAVGFQMGYGHNGQTNYNSMSGNRWDMQGVSMMPGPNSWAYGQMMDPETMVSTGSARYRQFAANGSPKHPPGVLGTSEAVLSTRQKHYVILWNLGSKFTEEDLLHQLDEIDFTPDGLTKLAEVEGAFLIEYNDEMQAAALVVALHGTTEDILNHGGSSPLKISRCFTDKDGGTSHRQDFFPRKMDDLPPEVRYSVSVTLRMSQGASRK